MSGTTDGMWLGALAGGVVGTASAVAMGTARDPERLAMGGGTGLLLGGAMGAAMGSAISKKLDDYREERDQCVARLQPRFP